MNSQRILTSKDNYIEINGKKAAVIESYQLVSTRNLYDVQEFSSPTPVATVGGLEQHKLELKSVYFIGQGKIEFHTLSNFTLAIVKPDCKITYSNCEWNNISEVTAINSPCIETITVVSQRRSVL